MDPEHVSKDQLVEELRRLREELAQRDPLGGGGSDGAAHSSEVFRRLVENANDIVYSLSAEGTFLYVSPNWTEQLGHDTSEVVGQSFVPFVHPDDIPACMEFLRRVFETREKQSGIEYRVTHKAGGYRWHTSNAFLIEGPDGETIYGGIAHDITRSKELEAQLAARQAELERLLEQASQNRAVLQAILDVSPNALLLVDRAGAIKVTNRYLTEFFGIEVAELDRMPIATFIDRVKGCFDRPQAFVALTERLSARSREAQGTADTCCADAFAVDPHELMVHSMQIVRPCRRDVAPVITPVFDARGERVGDLWVIADFTRFKAAEQQLHTIVEASPVPLIITRVADGKVLFANQPLAQLVGTTTDAIAGLRTPDFYARSEDRDDVLARLAVDGQLRDHEVLLKRIDGSTFWALLSIVLTDVGGEAAVLGGVYDIDDRRRMEDALRVAMAELEQANRELREAQLQLVQSEKMASLGMLVAGIAHEINTPLGAIGSMHNTLMRAVDKLEALESVAGGDRQRLVGAIHEANKVIDSGVRRVTDLVGRLRSFARLDEAELKRVDLHRGIEDTLVLVSHELKARVRVVCDFGELPPVQCYPGRLNQVFLNLLINAAQSIEGQGEIAIITRGLPDGRGVSVAVRDSGRGIRPEHLPRVFDPGFTTKGVGVGTGLGLSICYKIVEEHRGRIDVESEPGRGSTFTVVLPTSLD